MEFCLAQPTTKNCSDLAVALADGWIVFLLHRIRSNLVSSLFYVVVLLDGLF